MASSPLYSTKTLNTFSGEGMSTLCAMPSLGPTSSQAMNITHTIKMMSDDPSGMGSLRRPRTRASR